MRNLMDVSGFVGPYLVEDLVRAGWNTRVPLRSGRRWCSGLVLTSVINSMKESWTASCLLTGTLLYIRLGLVRVKRNLTS